MPIKIDEHTGILIKKAARLFEQVANQNLESLGVTYSQTIFLVRLWEKDGQTQIELARSAGLKQPSVVRILDRMERDKLITRERSEVDRRAYHFFLTDKAKKACMKLEDHANKVNQQATEGMVKKDVMQLNKLLLAVIQKLEKYT